MRALRSGGVHAAGIDAPGYGLWTAPLTPAPLFPIVPAMNGLKAICGICREIIR